jgi:GTP-binding protein LepA
MSNYDILRIRNFAIIAHIDHGKSTLADRLLEITKTVSNRNKKERIMDTLELEQERGITIKLQTARMEYHYNGQQTQLNNNEPYILNLVDTPGHVDFNYEVSRSLAASEGAILLIDAGQGIQAQTLTNYFKALEEDLVIIPVINKIDLPNIDLEQIKSSMINTFGFKEEEIILTSGKSGEGVEQLLNSIVERVPSPKAIINEPTKCLIYDSFFHEYKGVIALVKVVSGQITINDKLYAIGTQKVIDPIEIGFTKPELIGFNSLRTGEIGYIATGLKDIKDIHVGDTLTINCEDCRDVIPLPGYTPPKPMVYASLYPIEADDFDIFSDALSKLSLNDSALTYQKESSKALGSGYLCGFLGLLHMEITQERLSREFDIEIITTSPSVEYYVELTTTDYSKLSNINTANIDENRILHVHTASEFPDPSLIKAIKEPWVDLEIITPEEYLGNIMDLCQKNRGVYKAMEYISSALINGSKQVMLHYEIPVSEIITNFFDKLKSVSQGYASMDYTNTHYIDSDIVKVSVLINHEKVEALSFLSHITNAEYKGRNLVEKLSELIPRQQIPIPIQAGVGMKIFARSTIKAYRKDVLAKMSGGDVSRKIKLLEKQKKGKKKAKEKLIGKISIPQDVFLKALRLD